REGAEIASLHCDIKDFASGYETAVGERGITLSGGQKQRAAIARAIVRDPRILILDDALSSVDTQTEEKILSGLRGVMGGRTTSCSSAAATTRTCTRNSCLRKSSKTHEQPARRRGLRQSLRLAPDAAAPEIHEAVPLARGFGARAGGGGHAARARAPGYFPESDRRLFGPGDESGLSRKQGLDGGYLAESVVSGRAVV